MNDGVGKHPPAVAASSWAAVAPWLAALPGGVLFVLTIHSPPSLLVLVNYLALILSLTGFTMLAMAKWRSRRRWIKLGGIVVGLVLVLWYASRDTYQTRWQGEEGVRYSDTYGRWSRRITERYVFYPDGDCFHGPMAGRTKPHGEWVYVPRSGWPRYSWFWYGEAVSEGEWHLRNRGR